MPREIKSPIEIQEMIREAAAKCKSCADCYFGGVYWHEPDETGCNWSCSTMRGEEWRDCLACVQPMAIELRAKYNLADPGFMNTLLALSREENPEIRVGVALWLQLRDYARPSEEAACGAVITDKGREWLAITKYTG